MFVTNMDIKLHRNDNASWERRFLEVMTSDIEIHV